MKISKKFIGIFAVILISIFSTTANAKPAKKLSDRSVYELVQNTNDDVIRRGIYEAFDRIIWKNSKRKLKHNTQFVREINTCAWNTVGGIQSAQIQTMLSLDSLLGSYQNNEVESRCINGKTYYGNYLTSLRGKYKTTTLYESILNDYNHSSYLRNGFRINKMFGVTTTANNDGEMTYTVAMPRS